MFECIKETYSLTSNLESKTSLKRGSAGNLIALFLTLKEIIGLTQITFLLLLHDCFSIFEKKFFMADMFTMIEVSDYSFIKLKNQKYF